MKISEQLAVNSKHFVIYLTNPIASLQTGDKFIVSLQTHLWQLIRSNLISNLILLIQIYNDHPVAGLQTGDDHTASLQTRLGQLTWSNLLSNLI